MSNTINVEPITEQDIEDAAVLFLLAINTFIGFDKSALEVGGAAHGILATVLFDLNQKHEQTTAGSEATGTEGDSGESPEVSGAGQTRGQSKSAQGDSKVQSGKTPRNGAKKPKN